MNIDVNKFIMWKTKHANRESKKIVSLISVVLSEADKAIIETWLRLVMHDTYTYFLPELTNQQTKQENKMNIKSAMEQAIESMDSFSIWNITQYIRQHNINLENNAGEAIDTTHENVKNAFLYYFSDFSAKYNLKSTLEFASNGVDFYRLYTKNDSNPVPTNDSIDKSAWETYLKNRMNQPTTLKQVQSRFKEARLNCVQLWALADSFGFKIDSPGTKPISKLIVSV